MFVSCSDEIAFWVYGTSLWKKKYQSGVWRRWWFEHSFDFFVCWFNSIFIEVKTKVVRVGKSETTFFGLNVSLFQPLEYILSVVKMFIDFFLKDYNVVDIYQTLAPSRPARTLSMTNKRRRHEGEVRGGGDRLRVRGPAKEGNESDVRLRSS